MISSQGRNFKNIFLKKQFLDFVFELQNILNFSKKTIEKLQK